MLAIFKKKWIWIVTIFLIINIAGLIKIISLIEKKQGYKGSHGIFHAIGQKVRSTLWQTRKSEEPARTTDRWQHNNDLVIRSIEPDMSGTSGYIAIRVSGDFDLDKIKGYISIEPEVAFYMENTYYGIRLNGDFTPGENYRVEVLKGLAATGFKPLEETYAEEVVIPDYDPSLQFTSAGMYMSLEGNQLIPVDVVNVDNLDVTIHRVYANNIVYLLNNMSSYSIPEDLGVDVFTKEIKTGAELNEKKQTLIDLREILSNDSHGLFFMRVSDAKESSYKSDNKLLLTTDIGILAKKSESDLLVWLNSISTTQEIANATVRVFSKTNQQIIEGTTDLDGFVHFKDVDWSGDRNPFVITASTDTDLSYIDVLKYSITETVFDIEGRPYLSSGYEGFIYSDRGIYRPGETVHLRAILRGVGIEVPDSFPVVFDIKKPDGMRFDKVTGILSSFGTADIDLPIPDYALTGVYKVSLKLPGDDKEIGSYSFSVEEFVPDRMKVETTVPEKRFKAGESIPVKVKAEHLFGAPASGRLVEAKYVFKPVNFEVKRFSDYTFSDDTVEFTPKTVNFGSKDTDENGEADIEIAIPKEIRPPSALSAVITTTVKELGGRAVTSYSKAAVDPYPYYIGVRKTIEGYAEEGEEVQFEYVLMSPDENEISVEELDVEVCKIIWNTTLQKDKNGRYKYVSDEREECIFEETIKTDVAAGKFTFTPDSYGSYTVRIKGKEETAHAASLKFHTSGYGYMPWAMERPDRIDLELDKKTYSAGDEAKLLIKSPIKGKALITISKDNIISTKVINLENETQEIPITISADFAPNAYCSVTVIKPVVPGEEWSTHRAYGIIPVMFDNEGHQLKVSVTSPESTLPRKEVDINIDVSNAQGLPETTELSVALVDEGVLRLTGFQTPDPLNFFFGKKGQRIETMDLYSLLMPEFGEKKVGSDSSPSGDKAANFDPKKHMNPISAERVKPVVLWKSGIVTDEQGKATVKFDIPQFAGNLKVMVVSTGQDDFGNGESDIKVTEPLMIKPTFPRFLSSEDRFELPVSVFNTSGSDGLVQVQIEMSPGFKVRGQKKVDVFVRDNAEGFVRFPLVAPELPQKGTIKITASMGTNSTYAEVEIPVRPATPSITKSGSGSIKAPSNEKLSLPGKWLKGTEQYSLSVMPLPGIKLAGGLGFLAKYPYGCIEQTTSTVFPLLYLNDVAKLVESKTWSGRSVANYINAGIKRILSMQTYAGGFSYWPGYNEPNAYGSVYATDFLVEADKAGYVVPKLEKDVALDYLEKTLSSKETDHTLDLKVYSVMVLAKAGRVKSSWIRRLQEQEDELPAYSRYHLALALAYMGDDKGVSDMLGQSFPDGDVQRETGGSLNSYTKQNAIALSAYMDVAPESEMVPVLVKRVESSMVDGRWGTTQDNAMALLALGKYARYVESQDQEYSGSVALGEKIIAGFDNASPAIIKDMNLGSDDIDISVQGRGNVYYYWNASGIPLVERIEEIDAGIKIRRRFLDRDGKQINKNNIAQGQVVIVEISFDADLNYENVVISDMLPAGFEIENPRIETRDGSGLAKENDFVPDHMDIRDDRFLIFTDLPTGNKFTYKYVVRSVTKGDFILPPISAECMYDPSIKSVNGQGRVIIK